MNKSDLPSSKRILLVLIVAVLVACSWLAPLEPSAQQTVDAGLKRALVSFATARALNAVISVAQGTEIAVQPAGVGVTFSPGQALDPVNDLIEQFSNLMLTASIAFGVEKMLITIGAHWMISLLLTLVALAWAVCHLRRPGTPSWLSRLLVVLLMLRFALPLAVISSDLLFEQFMAADYQSSQQGIESVSGQLDRINPPTSGGADEPGLIDKLKNWTAQPADVKTRYSQLKQAAEQATERIITLMVIFLLQTLLLPVALLWVLWGFVRSLLERMPAVYRDKNP